MSNKAPPNRFHLVTAAKFRSDPRYAAAYLESVLAYSECAEVKFAIRRLLDANGGIAKICKRMDLNATSVAKSLSVDGTLELCLAHQLLLAMGLRLAVRVIDGSGSEST